MWTPSLADGGVIQPLDDYIAKYMNVADLEDYHPLYKALPTYKGKIWGFFDDGDVFALYYRKDIFEDPKLMEAYQAKFGKALAPPKTWEEYSQIAQFITDNLAPNVYGAGHFRKAGSPGNQFDFLQQFRANGGQLFDENMRSQITSEAGVKTFENMIAANAASIPGNNELDAVSLWAAFLTGKVAMIYSWPPRPDERRLLADRRGDQLHPEVGDRRQGRLRGRPGNPEHATGFNKGAVGRLRQPGCRLSPHAVDDVAAGVARPCHACPYALRDPYRLSHFVRPLCPALAGRQGYHQPQQLGQRRALDPIIPGAQDYFRPSTDGDLGGPGPTRRKCWATAAAEMDATTDRLGADRRRPTTPSSSLPGRDRRQHGGSSGMAVTLD
jgi:multiple sugar transport system substrate-binding protein